MLKLIPKHSFAMKAHFEKVIMLTFAIPKKEILPLIPNCLDLDSYNNKWGFITIAFVKAKGLRPKGFPKFMGSNLILSGYRVFVSYVNKKGKRLRGIYIIKSETDSYKVKMLGNLLTNYNYTFSDVELNEEKGFLKSNKSNFVIEFQSSTDGLPEESPFPEWKVARRYIGPLPHTFSYDEKKNEVMIIRGVRSTWHPQALKINNYEIPFLKEFHFSEIKLANAFQINDIPYEWEKGITEKLND